MTYFLVFLSAIAAATVLPLSSEFAAIAAIKTAHNPWGIWLIATLGNTLGSVINWALGRYLEKFKHRSWFPFNDTQLESAQNTFNRYGLWSLLFAWVPIIGDGLTLVAGVMKVKIWVFTLLVATGKAARYAFIILAFLSL